MPVIEDWTTSPLPIGEASEGRCVIYLWKIAKHMVFKVGVTAPHLGLKRLHEVINDLGHDAQIHRVTKVADAEALEAKLLGVGTPVPVDMKTGKLSGRYEFVEYTPEELEEVLGLIDRASLET